MKTTYIYLLLIIPIFAFCDLNIDKVNRVLSGLESTKVLKFYNANTSLKHKLQSINTPLHFTTKQQADIWLFPTSTQGDKLLIVNSYSALKKNEQRIIGAIYTKKGRTQIFFVRERLNAKGLKLPANMEKYLISECYLHSICLLQ